MNVNLHHLELFYYVAKAKGISQAVKIIPYGIQQPAVSQQLMKLEDSLGVKLFERKPFSLTPAGEDLKKFLSKFFDNIDMELASLKDKSGLRLRFGCPSIISAKYLPMLIREVMAKFPAVRPHIYESDGILSLAKLTNREIDVAITFAAPMKSKAMEITRIAKFPMTIVLPKGHRFMKKGFWPKTDFASEKWIAVQEASGGTIELLAGLSQFGVSPVFSASTSSIEAAMDYVEMGLGIALMAMPPRELVKGRNIDLLSQDDIFGSIDLSVVWMKDSPLDAKILNHVVRSAKSIMEKIMV